MSLHGTTDHDAETTIALRNVSKRFRVQTGSTWLARALAKLRGAPPPKPTVLREHWALEGIDLEIHKGESVGIIGLNGSGKTTLLSLVAGTMYPTSGHVDVRGRVGSLLELGAGFHPDLTGVENIYLNAALLGLTRREVEDRLQAIVEFADIGEAIHAPLSTYSSGMYARLGFSVIAHVDPDIVLIDEVFSVGDATFVEKSERAVMRFLERGCTFVLVSHGIEQVRRICQKAIWIERGRIAAQGTADEVCDRYNEALACWRKDVEQAQAARTVEIPAPTDPAVPPTSPSPTHR